MTGAAPAPGGRTLLIEPWRARDRLLFAALAAALVASLAVTVHPWHDAVNDASVYVLTARSKGLTENGVLYGHIFRNAMLLVIAGFPSAFVSAFFTGSLLIEVVFSLDGLGLLGFESVINRDYPVVFATLFIFTLLGLVMHIITDFVYTLVDPRIDFESREV